MANRAYLSLWCRDFSVETLLDRLEQLLQTAPLSSAAPGFTSLVIRAVGPEETPLAEHDLRAAAPLDAVAVAELASEHLHKDCAYEVQGYWDLWTYDLEKGHWKQQPQPLELVCFAEAYDVGEFATAGHFQLGVGFEHLFTGHAGLLGTRRASAVAPQHPIEAKFLDRMALPEHLSEYRAKTTENIRRLHDWIRRIEAALPVARYKLWSEGEENFEARLDEVLAQR